MTPLNKYFNVKVWKHFSKRNRMKKRSWEGRELQRGLQMCSNGSCTNILLAVDLAASTLLWMVIACMKDADLSANTVQKLQLLL